MTRFALIKTFRLVRIELLTPPISSLEVHVPSSPVAVFLPLTVSKRILSASKASMNSAPAFAASGSQETTGPCFSAAPQPSVQ